MTVQHVTDLNTPIGDLLRTVGPEGTLLESSGQARFALMPLDDDLIDFLIERNPKFIEQCRQIRESMRAGRYKSHEEVKKLLSND